MGIRHRLNRPQALFYHKQYGSLENPPFQNHSSKGIDPWPANGAMGTWSVGLVCGTKHQYFPRKLKIDTDTVVAGLIRNHDRQRNGVGPGQGFSSWVATKIIVRGVNGSMFNRAYYEVDPSTGKRTMLSFDELAASFKFSARSAPKKEFYLPHNARGFRTQQELNLEEEALQGMWIDYEELHSVTMPWKLMNYRKAREVQ